MLSIAEKLRYDVAGLTPRERKSAMGQFMTPARVAQFMASLFKPRLGPFRLLDPGAGLGALSCAVLDCWKEGRLGSGGISLQAHEIDDGLRPHLEQTLEGYTRQYGVVVSVAGGDYLDHAAGRIEKGQCDFTHVILNPPYKKIGIDSDARSQARRIGLETVNLYSAFVGMALSQLADGGQLVAIIPRSFCNGPYYKRFRRFILKRAALQHIHLFDSRSQAFREDDVLQENVILLLARGVRQAAVSVSISTNDTFDDLRTQSVPFDAVVKPGDREYFIHIPHGDTEEGLAASSKFTTTLEELGITVSTGPIVDFRMREHLVAMPTKSSVPLLYPQHFNGPATVWPIKGSKKANAIENNAETERSLWPAGTYIVVRRFSSKEEKRRVVASIVQPEKLGEPPAIGFENHLNVFHQKKSGLPVALAWGLSAYLNSAVVDRDFRGFNGHTQVNATDLRNIGYPTREALINLGKWAMKSAMPTPEEIEMKMERLLR